MEFQCKAWRKKN